MSPVEQMVIDHLASSEAELREYVESLFADNNVLREMLSVCLEQLAAEKRTTATQKRTIDFQRAELRAIFNVSGTTSSAEAA